MGKRIVVSLTTAELALLRAILGFVEAGDVSGGPLDDDTPQQRSANLRVFAGLYKRVFDAEKK